MVPLSNMGSSETVASGRNFVREAQPYLSTASIAGQKFDAQ